MNTQTIYKIKNKTNQYFQLIGFGYLSDYGELKVTEITDQMKKLEKMGLISIRPA
jgi:DNA-binding MarR family transcriptional regulator